MTSNAGDIRQAGAGHPADLASIQAALRESEERYALAMQGANDGIWDWDIASGKVFYSDRWKEILGYAPDEISGDLEEWKKRIHPDDFQRVMAAHREHFEGRNTHFEVEYRLRHKDGAYRWILGRGACFRDAKGVPIRAAGSHIDITRRKEVEEALHRSEERLKAVLSAMPDLIFRIDRNGTFLDFHAASTDRLALPPDRFLGKRISDVMPPEVAEKGMEHIGRVLRGESELPVFEYSLPIGGKMYDFEARISRCGPEEVIAIVRDVTEKKRAEEALRRTEEHLRQVRNFEATGRLTGGIAHHLNNLMTVVTGYCELLLGKVAPNDPLRQGLERINEAGERATELTRELLAFGRQQVLRPETVGVHRFLSDLVPTLRDLAGARVRFRYSPGEGTGMIRVDRDHLRRALMHLVSNARNAMPGGGEIQLSSSTVDGIEPSGSVDTPSGRFVLLTLRDNGSGMDAETRERIFEPFHTLKTGTEGLGLPSVYGFVKQSGGFIFVDSAPGRGTTFRIYFPCIDGANAPE